ncbi:MAG: hydrolase [Firmicutes bacterium]|nr:hydrolase [Bacillota bacterium]
MDKFTLHREDSAFVVIDIQERLAAVMKYGKQAVKNNAILLAAAREFNMPVLVTEHYPQGLGKTVAELGAELGADEVYEKIIFSAVGEGEIAAVLRGLGRKKLIVTGMETHVCVLQSVRDMLSLGFHVHVVGDGVCSRTKENYRNGLEQMSAMGAVITNTETVVFDLLKRAGTPEFKKLSRLIK